MDAAKNAFEIQAQAKHNAELLTDELKSLSQWEKFIKQKEIEIQNNPAAENKDLPVRSQQDEDRNKTVPVSTSDSEDDKRRQSDTLKMEGNEHVKRGDFDKAVFSYSQAIDIYNEEAVYYSNRALCYHKLGKFDQCIDDCDFAIDLDVNCVKAYYRRMQANESLGNYATALKDCTTVLMIEPKNMEAKKSLKRINERLRSHKNETSLKASFLPPHRGFIDIPVIDKDPHKRSTKALHRVQVVDIVGSKDSKNFENSRLHISDEEIDKIFNSNCGPYVEVKKGDISASSSSVTTPTTPLVSPSSVNPPLDTKTAISAVETKTKVLESVVFKDPSTMTSKNLAEKPSTTDKQTNPTKNSKAKGTDLAQQPIIKDNFAHVPLKAMPPVPISTGQFYSNWKDLTNVQKYQYFKAIATDNVAKILGAGLDSDTLAEVLNVLHDFYVPHKDTQLLETLYQISRNTQVGILSLLFSADERKVLNGILNAMKENENKATTKNHASLLQEIMKNFNLN